jgi:C4-dicarboxylate-specific signal transduction histidine kinase
MEIHPLLKQQLLRSNIVLDQALAQFGEFRQFLQNISRDYYQLEQTHRVAQHSDINSQPTHSDKSPAIIDSEFYKRSIFEFSIDGIIITDPGGLIIEINPAIINMFEAIEFNLVNQHISLLLPNYRIFSQFVDTRYLTENKSIKNKVKAEIRAHTILDQKGFPVEVSCIPVIVDRSKKTVYIWFIRDLRKQKIFEKIIETQKTELTISSKLATLGEMAGGIAHEINTPLTTIKFSIDLLKNHLTENVPDIDYILNKSELIDKTIARISTIVKNLRNFARDGSADPFKKENIIDIIEDSLTLCREKIKRSNIQLEFSATESKNLFIFSRAIQISQVILNLLNNSLDAIENLPVKWLFISLKEDNGKISIIITDSGNGIPEPILEKIFNPFFTTKPPGKGTGMGLSISSNIIKAHNGELYYDNKAENTSFVIKLPIYRKD